MKDAETWPGKKRKGDRVLEEKIENNIVQASWLNDSATGSRHGVSAKLYMKHANCYIAAFL